MPTNEQRDVAYAAGSPAQRYLYAHSDSGAALYAIAEKYDLTAPATYTTFVLLVGDVVLRFFSIEQLPTLLEQQLRISPQAAKLITADVQVFMQPLNNPAWRSPQTSESLADELAAEIVSTDIALELADTEASLHAQKAPLSSAATAALDAEVTYSSTQSAILSEGLQNPPR